MASCYRCNQRDRFHSNCSASLRSSASTSHRCACCESQARFKIRPDSEQYAHLILLACLLIVGQVKAQNLGKSELNFDNQALGAVPAKLCAIYNGSRPIGLAGGVQQVDAASFAHNGIRTIEPDAFVCIGRSLKILSLRFNDIELISDGAFNQLDRVQVLLLDNNRLNSIPSIETLRPMISLRHLDLANNRIEWINNNSFGPSSNNLISLNLRANPVKHLAVDSLIGLDRLKTLLVSQSALSGQLNRLAGLLELRFLHLDRATDLSSISADLCLSSRRLTSLVLKSNRIQRVPEFAHCQDLLLLDLSYNLLAGELAANFTNQPNLIDLYLSHNRLEFVNASAFAGLHQLQVLELADNWLKWIHPAAFAPSSSSLVELGLSNNPQLAAVPALGLEQLLVFKAFGNPKLRELPRLKRARSLWLTYAYHCCDYSGTSVVVDHLPPPPGLASSEESTGGAESLLMQLVHSMTAKLIGLLGPAAANKPAADGSPPEQPLSNYSELVLWPDLAHRRERPPNSHDMNTWRAELAQSHPMESGRQLLLTESEIGPHEGRPSSKRRKRSEQFMQHNGRRLIDELVREVKQARRAHRVGELNHSYDLPGDHSFDYSTAAIRVQLMSRPVSSSLAIEVAARHLAAELVERRRPTRDNAREQPESGIRCLPEPSAFLPCRDLFDSWWLRAGIWLVFSLAFAGNILVIVVLSSVRQSSSTSALTSIMWLAHSRRHIDVPRFLVINLAVADLLMALYLGLLAFVDLSTLGQFKLFAIKWQYSTGCKLAGFLGVLSSELSVFILAIITLERNYAITNAVHLNRRLSLQKAMLIMLLGYTLAICMALAPLNGINDYRKFSICLPLDIHSNLASRLYLATLVGINTLSFVLLLGCYLRMYCAIRGSQAWNANDLRIAKRMSILVLTDFLCWIPLIVVAIGSLLGFNLIGLDGLKVLTIFVLPLNSVANPFLYAITTKKFKRDLKTLRRRLRLLGTLNRNQPDQHLVHKDSKIFANYNQYQQNLVLRKRVGRRHHLTINELTPGGCQSERHASHRARYSRAQTLNQVTVNRTSMSIRLGPQEENVEVLQAVNLEPSRQPRILLEPVGVDDAMGPDMHLSDSPHLLDRPCLNRSSSLRPSSHLQSQTSNPLESCLSSVEQQRLAPRLEPSPVDRAASACSYRSVRVQCKLSAAASHDPLEPNASASCETIIRSDNQAGQRRHRLSRSINRLLFSPIAKAWSSIQISLSSSNAQMANTSATCACSEIAGKPRDSVSRKNSDKPATSQTSSTIDELLLLSSPSLRACGGERRMSRSCDLIPAQIPHSPTSSLHEPTTSSTMTSQAECDDDQRILLATISRLRSDKGPSLELRGRAERDQSFQTGRYLRSRCTRCRSWSPALLSKLEDCIDQIKSKLPKLKSAKETSEREEETMRRTSSDSSDLEAATSQQAQAPDQRSLWEGEHEAADEHECNTPDCSMDRFNEREPGDWSLRRGEMIRKFQAFKLLNRMQHQSSINSDTLSTRTAGTLVTNISMSFESSTSIANLGPTQSDDPTPKRPCSRGENADQ